MGRRSPAVEVRSILTAVGKEGRTVDNLRLVPWPRQRARRDARRGSVDRRQPGGVAARHLRPGLQISKDYNRSIIEITESGCGYLDGPDEEQHGRIPDLRRIQWYREVLAELSRAIADGARIRAFHAWTLLDNFQWAEGYTERYGLIYTDFRNQKRTIKDSGLWYGRVAASNRL
jgi:(2Fe-2S) ferredoxin